MVKSRRKSILWRTIDDCWEEKSHLTRVRTALSWDRTQEITKTNGAITWTPGHIRCNWTWKSYKRAKTPRKASWKREASIDWSCAIKGTKASTGTIFRQNGQTPRYDWPKNLTAHSGSWRVCFIPENVFLGLLWTSRRVSGSKRFNLRTNQAANRKNKREKFAADDLLETYIRDLTFLVRDIKKATKTPS